MTSPKKISKKIIVLGHFGVGKTSLVRRFVEQKFSEEYKTTIGVNMKRKVLTIEDTQLTMIIWDLEGGASQKRLPQPYFLGASGIVYVFDLTRASTYENLQEELSYFTGLLPGAAVQVVGNKIDLLDPVELESIKAKLAFQTPVFSSAKSGENVEEMFLNLGISMLK